jgi:hypothetical protein
VALQVDVSGFETLTNTGEIQPRALRTFGSSSSVGSAGRDTMHHYNSTGSVGDGLVRFACSRLDWFIVICLIRGAWSESVSEKFRKCMVL